MFYIFLILVPLLLHFIGFKFLTFKYRNNKPPKTKMFLLLSQLPLYLVILLTIIGYSDVVLYSSLFFYLLINITFQILAHKSTKKFKENFIKSSKLKFKNSLGK